MKKMIFIFAVLFILLSSLAVALTEDHGIVLDEDVTQSGYPSDVRGMQFKTNQTITINTVTINSNINNGDDMVWLTNSAHYQIKNASCTNFVATLDIEIPAGTYQLLAGGAGGGTDAQRQTDGVSYPYFGSVLNWTSSCGDNCDTRGSCTCSGGYATQAWNIENLTYTIVETVTSDIDLLFNTVSNSDYRTTFNESELILGWVNYTLSNGTVITDSLGDCNMTISALDLMQYESGDSLWRTQISHPYSDSGIKYISGNCSFTGDVTLDNSITENITILNLPPSIDIGNITTSELYDLNLSGTITVEFTSDNFLFNYSVTDDDLDTVITYISNSTTLLYTTYNTSNFQINSSYFIDFDEQPFNFTIWANDTEGNISRSTAFFNFTDTALPTFSGFTNTSIANGTSYGWDVTLSDDYLWSFSINCSNGFNFTQTSIAATSYNFINNSGILSENLTCNFNISDGHTKYDIEDMDVNIDLINNKVSFDSVMLEVDETLEQISYNKKHDRYSMCFETKQETQFLHINIPDNCVIAPDSTWESHLICDDRYWVDFENDRSFTSEIIADQVVINAGEKENTFCFNSIGILNTVSGMQEITVTLPIYDTMAIPEEWSDDFDLNTTAGVMILFFYLALLTVLFIIGVILRIPVLVWISASMLFFLGFMIAIKLSLLFGILTCVSGCILFIVGAMMMV